MAMSLNVFTCFVWLLIHSFTGSLVHSFVRSVPFRPHSFIHSFVRSFVLSIFLSFVYSHSLVSSFVHSLNYYVNDVSFAHHTSDAKSLIKDSLLFRPINIAGGSWIFKKWFQFSRPPAAARCFEYFCFFQYNALSVTPATFSPSLSHDLVVVTLRSYEVVQTSLNKTITENTCIFLQISFVQ